LPRLPFVPMRANPPLGQGSSEVGAAERKLVVPCADPEHSS